MDNNKRLFDLFPPVSKKEWMDRITADLKGADFNEKLVWRSDMGFDMMPFYMAEDIDKLHHVDTVPGTFPFIRGKSAAGNSWNVRQDIEVTDYSEANKKALSVLMRGVDSLGFMISDPETITPGNFRVLLKDIHLGAIGLNIRSAGKAREIMGIIAAACEETGTPKEALNGAIEADPLGRLMVNGTLCVPVEDGMDYLAGLVKAAVAYPQFRVLQVSGDIFCNAGADIVTQLAYTLSMGSEYLAQLTSRGISAGDALSSMRFCFATGPEYFAEIARLRAARMLWSLVASSYLNGNEKLCRMDIHCKTGNWNKTLFDPYVNMLRTQTEAMSAILGGTDSLTVAPFDEVFRKPDDFSERIARNQQLILREESYFDKVADPAAGSYYIENLTARIADEAWKLFISIEEQGGFLAALREGTIQKRIAEKAAARREDVASGKLKLLGTNLYPNLKEEAPGRYDTRRMFAAEADTANCEVEPVKLFRGAEATERERLEKIKGGAQS